MSLSRNVGLARSVAVSRPRTSTPTIVGDAYAAWAISGAEAAEGGPRAGFHRLRRANLLRKASRARQCAPRKALETPRQDLPIESLLVPRVIGATLFDRRLGRRGAGDARAAEADARQLRGDQASAELRSYQRRDRKRSALRRAIALAAHPVSSSRRPHARVGGAAGEAKRCARGAAVTAVAAGTGYYRNLAMFFTDVEPKPDQAVVLARKTSSCARIAAWSTRVGAAAQGNIAGAGCEREGHGVRRGAPGCVARDDRKSRRPPAEARSAFTRAASVEVRPQPGARGFLTGAKR